MNKIIIAMGMLFFMACAEKKVDSNQKEGLNSSDNKIAKTHTSTKIPILSFKELMPLLNKNNDSVYVVNFWATWCKPCIKELPAFEKINAEYKEEKVKVILVSLDFPEQLEKQLIPFVEKRDIISEVVLLDDADANSWIPKVSEKWSGAIPATIIYSNSERKFYERSFTYEELETELESILK